MNIRKRAIATILGAFCFTSFSALALESGVTISVSEIPDNDMSEMVLIDDDTALVIDETNGQKERPVLNILKHIADGDRNFDLGISGADEIWLTASDGSDKPLFRSSSITCYTCLKQVPGAGIRSDGAAKAVAYHVNSRGEIWRGNEKGWVQLPGEAVDVAAGSDGEVWVLGKAKTADNNHDLYRWNNGAWAKTKGNGTEVAVTKGTVYVSNDRGELYSTMNKGGSWKRHDIKNVKSVVVSNDGVVYALTDEPTSDGYLVNFSRDKGNSWEVLYTMDSFERSQKVEPLRAWTLVASRDNIWIVRKGGVYAGKVEETVIIPGNIAVDLVDSRYPVEPYRFQEGDMVVKNCTPAAAKVEVYDGYDVHFVTPKASAMISPGQVSRKLSCGRICWLRSSALVKHRVKPGHYVILPDNGDPYFNLRPTNADAQSRSCDIYEF
ncbi:MAG: hypothetical protein VW274_01640 [Thalassolituus sp.]